MIKLDADIKPEDYDFRNWLFHELITAFYAAKKGKRRTKDEHKFETFLLENVIQLADDIIGHRYKPSRGIAFVTQRPVIREIFAAPFRDRLVHHFLFKYTEPWFDNRFIYDSYSCRTGKGTLFGIKRLQHHIHSVRDKAIAEGKTGDDAKVYVLKFDIKGYFMSLPRTELYKCVSNGLKLQYKDNRPFLDLLLYIWREIIFDDPIKGVKKRGSIKIWRKLPKDKSLFWQPVGQGIVIGNLTSQLMSNIYLDQLDQFVTKVLGYKHYGRYVDDFYIVVSAAEYEKAKKDIEKIRKFLEGIKLKLHPRKCYIQEVSKGVEFLGVVVYPYCIVMGRRFKRNFYRTAAEVGMGKKDIESVVSYIGHSTHFNSKKFCAKVFNKMGWIYEY